MSGAVPADKLVPGDLTVTANSTGMTIVQLFYHSTIAGGVSGELFPPYKISNLAAGDYFLIWKVQITAAANSIYFIVMDKVGAKQQTPIMPAAYSVVVGSLLTGHSGFTVG